MSFWYLQLRGNPPCGDLVVGIRRQKYHSVQPQRCRIRYSQYVRQINHALSCNLVLVYHNSHPMSSKKFSHLIPLPGAPKERHESVGTTPKVLYNSRLNRLGESSAEKLAWSYSPSVLCVQDRARQWHSFRQVNIAACVLTHEKSAWQRRPRVL